MQTATLNTRNLGRRTGIDVYVPNDYFMNTEWEI